jgi:hypothetical protein
MHLKTCVTPDMLNLHSWQSQSTPGGTSYLGSFSGCDQPALKQALETCAAKAIGLLDKNIQEDSLYLLFEWNPIAAELRIVVTDAHKQHDGAYRVEAHFPELLSLLNTANATERNEQIDALNESIKFLLSDFLASYSPFFSYSLVAIFHSSSRAETSLL